MTQRDSNQPSKESPPARLSSLDEPLAVRLREAALTLLQSLPIIMTDLELPISQALDGSGEVMCDVAELDSFWAPLIEAETLRLVASAAGAAETSLFNPALPQVIAALDQQSFDMQFRCIARAADTLLPEVSQAPSPRRLLATARSPAASETPRSVPTPSTTNGVQRQPTRAAQGRRSR